MRKIIYTLVTFISIVYANGQDNLGINTDDPKQTLSIDGTLRVANMPLINASDFTPLAWRKLSQEEENGTNQAVKDSKGQIIASDDYRPMRIINYKFEMEDPSDDLINGVDLGYSTDEYTMLLSDYALTDPDGQPMYLEVLGITPRGIVGPIFSRWGEYRGSFGMSSTLFDDDPDNDDPHSDKHINYNFETNVMTGSPLIMTYPSNGTWHFYADYPGSKPVSYEYKKDSDDNYVTNQFGRVIDDEKVRDANKKYTWDVTFLVIDNTYMTRNKTSYEISVGSDNTGSLDLKDESGREIDPVTGSLKE